MKIPNVNRILATIALQPGLDEGIKAGDRGKLSWIDGRINLTCPNKKTYLYDICAYEAKGDYIENRFGAPLWDLQWVKAGEVI